MVVDRKYRKALALLCSTSGPLPNAENSRDVLRLDSMLRELRKLLCYDKHGFLELYLELFAESFYDANPNLLLYYVRTLKESLKALAIISTECDTNARVDGTT